MQTFDAIRGMWLNLSLLMHLAVASIDMPPMMRKILLLLILALLSMEIPLLSSETVSQPLPAHFNVEDIGRYLFETVKEKGIAGMSVAIMKDGKVVFSQGFGVKSVRDGSPVDSNTRFAIGSITKQFTSASILKLSEQGKLSITDKVAKYYPALSYADQISILDLMHHVSGYPDYYPLDFIDRKMSKPIEADDLINNYAGGKLDFEPGSRFSYSNTGYIILGRIIEKVSGKSYGDFLTETFFLPLGMTNTVYEPETFDGLYAVGHSSFALSPLQVAPREAKGWVGAAGGIYSTATDLMKWNLGLINRTVLRPESYTVFVSPRALKNGKSSGYGGGVFVENSDGPLTLSHGGDVSGYNAWSGFIPSTRCAVVYLCNQDGVGKAIPRQLMSLLKEDQPATPKIDGISALEAAKSILEQMQKGIIDRNQLGEEFNFYLSGDLLQKAAASLMALGSVSSIETIMIGERGGMEAAIFRFKFKQMAVKAYLYRTKDGKIQSFTLYKE